MSKLENIVVQISSKYKQLKKTQFGPQLLPQIGIIKALCKEAIKLIDNKEPSAKNMRAKKQIQDIQKKINQLELQIIQKITKQAKNVNQKIQYNNSKRLQQKKQDQKSMNRQQMSKIVMRTVLMEQIRSSQLNISPQQLEFIVKKMQNNLQIMKDINEMIVQQGEDLEKIQTHIQSAYENAQNANKQLNQAERLQIKGRMMKIRLGVSGFLGVIGLKILGIPGLIAGLFTGMVATSSLK